MGASFWLGLLALAFATMSWWAGWNGYDQLSEWTAIAAFGTIIAFVFRLTA